MEKEPQNRGTGEPSQEETVPEAQELSKEAEYLETLQRLQAEFINYRNRMEKERSVVIERTRNDLLVKFLEVRDNFERAPKRDEGIELIYKQFLQIFEEEEVEEIPDGTVFDPDVHEAIGTVDTHDRGTIVAVTRKGYKRHDHVLRPTQVIVGNKEPMEETKHE